VDPALPVAPATHAGTLPCADCPGIEWTLTVLDDGTYRLRRVYLDAKDGRDLAFIDIGRWDTGGADDRLVLRNLDDGPINLEARRDGAQRLVGKYINLTNPAITRPWVGRIVDDTRIDGCFPNGRLDFRR